MLVLWICSQLGKVALLTGFDPHAWYRHEALFGYFGAVIAAFLKNAAPHWAGHVPFAGAPLTNLAGIWLAVPLAVLFSSVTGSAFSNQLQPRLCESSARWTPVGMITSNVDRSLWLVIQIMRLLKTTSFGVRCQHFLGMLQTSPCGITKR